MANGNVRIYDIALHFFLFMSNLHRCSCLVAAMKIDCL